MFVKHCFFSILFLIVLDLKWCYNLEKKISKLIDPEWQCQTICVGNGGKAKFLPEYKICKCWIDKYIGDADLQVMLKNARAMDLKLITVEPIENRERNHVKRDISSDDKYKKIKLNLRTLGQLPNVTTLSQLKKSINVTLGQKLANLNKNYNKMEPLKLPAPTKALEERVNKLKSRLAEIKENTIRKASKIPTLKSRSIRKLALANDNTKKEFLTEKNNTEEGGNIEQKTK